MTRLKQHAFLKTLLILGLFIIPSLGILSPPLGAQSSPVKLAHGGGYIEATSNQYPAVMPYNNGQNVLVVWVEGEIGDAGKLDGSTKRLVYRIFADGVWGAKIRFKDGLTRSEFPQLAMDSAGIIHMVWMQYSGGARDIAHATFRNGAWDYWENTSNLNYFCVIRNNYNAVWPRIAIDTDDSIHVIFSYHESPIDVYHVYKAPGTNWISPVRIGGFNNFTSYHPDIAARNGRQYAVWKEYYNNDTTVDPREPFYVAFAERNGGAWTANIMVQGYGADWPMVGADSQNGVHVLYNAGTQMVYKDRTPPGSWQGAVALQTNSRIRQFVDIEVDDFDNTYAVFQQASDNPASYSRNSDRLVTRTRMATGEWLPLVNLYDGTMICAPVAKADNHGGLHIVWFDANYGNGNLGDKWIEQGSIWYVKAEAEVNYSVEVLSPNGGEVWRIGQEHTLTWEITVPAGETPPETVILEYSLDSGSTWNMLYDALPNLGYATAEIPRDVVQPSNQCRFRITDPDSGMSDISDQDFILLPPYAESGGSFVNDGIWEDGATAGVEGWHIGDFNGDGKDDLLNILINYNKVFVSDGTRFIKLGRWLQSVSGLYGWFPGDYDGDGMTDLMRYIPANPWGPDRIQVFLSTGESFVKNYVWSYADPGSDGFTVGDFNGDGMDDMLIYDSGSNESQVHLSNGSEFLASGVWFTGHNGADGWYTGDFNGDGMTDLARVHPQEGTAVLLSTGSSFVNADNWTSAISNSIGWIVGDVNGDGKDDLTRYVPGMSTADVFLAIDGAFAYDGSWSDISATDCIWRMGDFNGDGLDDLLNFDSSVRVTRVFLSTAASGAAGTTRTSRFLNHQSGDLNRGINPERPALSPETEADLIKPWLEKWRNGEEGNFFYAIKAEYEKQLGQKVRDVVIYRMFYRFLSPIEPR